ncbi:MAG TPA: RpiB/LacA/LacB family sugar-phosphate isomerase [Deltaproteobacteria bacterium]|nr:RpiB/LacA/LacB family sugar-phosphate isomerase [Deltaproteobacteria bacterium]
MVLGSRTTGTAVAEDIVTIWLKTEFEGGRHQTRLEKIESLAQAFITHHQR